MPDFPELHLGSGLEMPDVPELHLGSGLEMPGVPELLLELPDDHGHHHWPGLGLYRQELCPPHQQVYTGEFSAARTSGATSAARTWSLFSVSITSAGVNSGGSSAARASGVTSAART